MQDDIQTAERPAGLAPTAGCGASNVVFLDFDGVILTLRTTAACGRGWSRSEPDAVLVKALTRCCHAGVKIVVSSAWRDQSNCIPKLAECGLDKYLHEDWRTKEIRVGECRKDRPEEIREWLSRHPEVTSYRILDDDPWDWNEDQKPNSLECCPEDGASARTIMALCEWAGCKRHNSAIGRLDAIKPL